MSILNPLILRTKLACILVKRLRHQDAASKGLLLPKALLAVEGLLQSLQVSFVELFGRRCGHLLDELPLRFVFPASAPPPGVSGVQGNPM